MKIGSANEIKYKIGELASARNFYVNTLRNNDNSGDMVEFLLTKEKEKSKLNLLSLTFRKKLNDLKNNVENMKESMKESMDSYMDKSTKERFA